MQNTFIDMSSLLNTEKINKDNNNNLKLKLSNLYNNISSNTPKFIKDLALLIFPAGCTILIVLFIIFS